MLSLQRIHKSFDYEAVLKNVDFVLNAGEVVALIGANGAGKTTLLKIILGELKPDSGTVMPCKEVVGYVPQDMPLGDTIRSSFSEDTAEWRIDYALELVGLEKKSRDAPVDHLSGGEKTRLALAGVLARDPEPTMLLLDEPTNNLDAEALEWLEKFLRSFRGGVLLASHERSFINRAATKVVELHNGKLSQYGGNYDFYKQQEEIERQTEIQEYEKAMGEKKRLQKLKTQKAQMMQQTSNESFDKVKHESRMAFNNTKNASQRNFGKQIKALDSRIEQVEDVSRPEDIKNYHVSLSGDTHSSKLILWLEDISKSYDKEVLLGVNLEVRGSERLHITGPNGSGKTILLKIVAGLVEPDKGEVTLGTDVDVGYFSQDVDGLDYRLNGFRNLQSTEAGPTAIYHEARSLGLKESDLRKKSRELSRGQKAKLAFTKLLLDSHHLLILDEPTNHLDIPTRERIEAALQDYEGAMLVVSHDKYFVEQINIGRTLALTDGSMGT